MFRFFFRVLKVPANAIRSAAELPGSKVIETSHGHLCPGLDESGTNFLRIFKKEWPDPSIE
jgi:hypothetical protein